MTSPTPATPSLPKAGTPEAISKVSSLGGQQQTYASMSGGEFGPDMLAATGVGADRVNNTSPTKVSEPEIEQISNAITNYFNNDYQKEYITQLSKIIISKSFLYKTINFKYDVT